MFQNYQTESLFFIGGLKLGEMALNTCFKSRIKLDV